MNRALNVRTGVKSMAGITNKRTIGSVQDANAGYGAGFDFLRLALALLVMAFHSSATLGAIAVWETQPLWIVKYSLLPMFFALSGFLISASAMRLKLSQFLLNRGLRIVPALAVEIILSAVVIGALFTTLTPSEYFSDPQFWRYFTNIVGLINYQLPGVFHEHGQPGIVNAALWTIPYEIVCYAIISGMIICGIFKRPILIALAIMVFTVCPSLIRHAGFDGSAIPLLDWWFFGRGAFLFPSFLMGCLFHAIRYKIRFDPRVFAFCSFILIVSGVGLNAEFIDRWDLSIVLCFCITYVMAYIGLSNLPKIPVASTGDYSYGIYLYHCPIINCVYYFTSQNRLATILFVLSLIPVSLFAGFSWNCIEKPILKMRKKFSFVGKRLEQEAGLAHGKAYLQKS